MVLALFLILQVLIVTIIYLSGYSAGKSFQAMKMLFDLQKVDEALSEKDVNKSKIEFSIFLEKSKPSDTKFLDDMKLLNEMRRIMK